MGSASYPADTRLIVATWTSKVPVTSQTGFSFFDQPLR